MKNIAFALCFFAAGLASATDLNLSVQSAGQNTIKVFPGQTIAYQVQGELSNNLNEGLAMFSFNLSFSGGPLSQANSPSSGAMLNFAAPLGLNNPAGFGGTVTAGNLIQVGGAQNTINNFFAPFPAGGVLTGVAWPGAAATLVSGSLTAPTAVGSYTLSASSLFANVIRQGETGSPFWHVDGAGTGSVANLTVIVEALTANLSMVSIGSPRPQALSLNAGTANAGRIYWLLGSVSGTTPGLQVNPNVHLPLNYDAYMQFTISNPNTALLSNSLGFLDGQGKATSHFTIPAGLSTSFIGITANHAFVLLQPISYASNPVSVTLAP